MVGGFNAPNRVVLTRDARPGRRFQIAVFGINGPISAAPANYIWMRTATLDVYAPGRAAAGHEAPLEVERHDAALDDVVPPGAHLERVAGGFEFTEGPVWTPGRRAAVLLAEHERDLPLGSRRDAWTSSGPRAATRALDIGRFDQPGSNGLAFDPDGPPRALPARQPAGRPRRARTATSTCSPTPTRAGG